MTNLSRRDFLKVLGVGGASAAAALALALVIMNAAMQVVAGMMQVASLGKAICPECR